MVRNFFPQSIQDNIASNTNNPPQSSEDTIFPPPTGLMEYQTTVVMTYEAGGAGDMEYES